MSNATLGVFEQQHEYGAYYLLSRLPWVPIIFLAVVVALTAACAWKRFDGWSQTIAQSHVDAILRLSRRPPTPTDAVMISSMGTDLHTLAMRLFADLYVWTTVFASLAVLHVRILSGCSDAATLDAGYDCFWVPSLKQRLDTSDFDFATCTLQDQANHTSADYDYLYCFRIPDTDPAAILAAAGTAAVVVTTLQLVRDSLRRAAVVWCTSRLDAKELVIKLPDPPTETGALGLPTVEKATIAEHIQRVKKMYTDRASVPRRVGFVAAAILFIAQVGIFVVAHVLPTLFASPTDLILVTITVFSLGLPVLELISGGCPRKKAWPSLWAEALYTHYGHDLDSLEDLTSIHRGDPDFDLDSQGGRDFDLDL